MDEKTERLRDIFIDATGTETATERQGEARGSLADAPDPEDRLRELVDAMDERYGFESDLGTDALVEVVRRYHDGDDDGAVAAALGVDERAVFVARMDLHLVRESDRAGVDFEALRALVVDGADDATVAAELDVPESTVPRRRRVAEAEAEATRANDRYRDEFADLLTDSALSGRLATDVRDDGLREATEDIETDVSF
jgi:hypothetical protein